MFVKICGTTNLDDARLAAASGADALGFIFAPSKRRVTVDQVAEITRQLPPGVLRVGVFTEPSIEEVVRTVSAAGLNAVQTHWPYKPEWVEAFRQRLGQTIPLWQVVGFPVEPANDNAALGEFRSQLRAALLDSQLDCVLLDAVKGGASGGLGQPFSWDRAVEIMRPLLAEAELARQERGSKMPHLVVAGGLNAANVGAAIQMLQPWGVDVVSGVEAGPGRKSPDRIRAFFEAVRPSK